MPWLIALLLGNPCEHIYILDNWETQFIVTWQLRVTLGSIQYSCNVLDQFSFWSSFSHLLLILSHICQSSVGSRMSWSNIFDFLWMSKQVGRVGPCFFPGGPKSWVRGNLVFFISRFLQQTGKEVFAPVAGVGLCPDPRFPKNLPQLAHFCNCVNICAPIFYKHLLERAWFENFLNDSQIYDCISTQVLGASFPGKVWLTWDEDCERAWLWSTWQLSLLYPSLPLQPQQTYDWQGDHQSVKMIWLLCRSPYYIHIQVGKEVFLELSTLSKDNDNGLKEELVFRVISFLSISRSREMVTPAAAQQMNSATAPQFNAIIRMLLKNTDAWKAKRRKEIEQGIAEELKRREAVEAKIPKECLVAPKVETSEDKVSCDVFKPDDSTEKMNKMTPETMSAIPDCPKTERTRNAKEDVSKERSCSRSDCSRIGMQRCAGCHCSLYCGQVFCWRTICIRSSEVNTVQHVNNVPPGLCHSRLEHAQDVVQDKGAEKEGEDWKETFRGWLIVSTNKTDWNKFCDLLPPISVQWMGECTIVRGLGDSDNVWKYIVL